MESNGRCHLASEREERTLTSDESCAQMEEFGDSPVVTQMTMKAITTVLVSAATVAAAGDTRDRRCDERKLA